MMTMQAYTWKGNENLHLGTPRNVADLSGSSQAPCPTVRPEGLVPAQYPDDATKAVLFQYLMLQRSPSGL